MFWGGWVIAVAALVAAGMFFVKLREARRAHSHALDEHEQALTEIASLVERQNQLMQIAASATVAQHAASAAREIDSPLLLARGNVELAAERLVEYRKLTKAYDAAVQYCLQPVEMIFGADPAALDQLVRHVEDARRKLFVARGELEKSVALSESTALLGDTAKVLGRPAAFVQSLLRIGAPVGDPTASTDLNACVDAALDLVAPQWGGRIDVVRDYGQLPLIRCQPAQIGQAILHLLANAGEAIAQTGQVTVRTRPAGARSVEIAVIDNGSGIDDDTLAQIFDPFFSTREDERHAGIGLAVVRAVVRAHAGSVNVRTTPGSGSSFLLALPIEGPIGMTAG